uniref:Uncharacterized protein n=1 Tax=Rhizophora mucronata TaxID=61149 RepID=A0A2P2N4K9_RHIMU
MDLGSVSLRNKPKQANNLLFQNKNIYKWVCSFLALCRAIQRIQSKSRCYSSDFSLPSIHSSMATNDNTILGTVD